MARVENITSQHQAFVAVLEINRAMGQSHHGPLPDWLKINTVHTSYASLPLMCEERKIHTGTDAPFLSRSWHPPRFLSLSFAQ